MKKSVISPAKATSVVVTEVSEDLYYGVSLIVRGKETGRAFITAESYVGHLGNRRGKFLVRCIDQLTIGNGFFTMSENQTLQEAIEKIMEDNKVFQFDTARELVEWLTEKD